MISKDKKNGKEKKSIGASIGKISRSMKDKKTIKEIWNKPSGGKYKKGSFYSKNVSNEDFNDMKECITKMKEAKDFKEYKPWFNKFCKLCMIPQDGCIIQKYIFNKGTDNKNEVIVDYAVTRHKIQIPNGCSLYHKSTVDNIKELVPTFRGKTGKFAYLHSEPRVYLTIKENMPNIAVDLKHKTKTTLYKTKENIRTAYVDPLLPNSIFGAVYVDTRFPIPVEKVPESKKQTVKESYEEDDYPVFDTLHEFVEYYGFEIDDEYDAITESFNASIGEKNRTNEAEQSFRKSWEAIANDIEHNKVFETISNEDKEKLQKWYNVLKESKVYATYKKAYSNICKYFDLDPRKTSIGWIKFTNSGDKDNPCGVKIRYHQGGRVRLIIPNGYQLIHTSLTDGLKELKPGFCSKLRGFYMWPSKRVYFTVGKAINPEKVGSTGSSYKYIPAENIRTAFIDSELPEFSMRCIYVETAFPIPVINVTKELSKK